ncbi:hypothetical protein PM082_018906 [Marasmius tenuissimus]|nr:hypothetical protein PM082_018906 [Marasmius tenuissimus]
MARQLLLPFLISASFSLSAKASTATFKAPINPTVTSGLTPITGSTGPTVTPLFSISTAYSQAGVKSDSEGSETTYVLERHVSQVTGESRQALRLFTATIVQSSNGFWHSLEDTQQTMPRVQYLTCSLESEANGNYACVQLMGWGPSTSTVSYTNTAVEVVVTNVAGVPEDSPEHADNHVTRTTASTIVWQVLAVLSVMIVGGVVVL